MKLTSAHPTLCWLSSLTSFFIAIHFLAFSDAISADDFQARRESDRVDLLHDGKLVTSYRYQSGNKPILWPLIGPDQTRMSREYPMVPNSQDEEHDHPHHRSLWMTFGEVEDNDFWAENAKHQGHVKHVELLEAKQSATAATVIARHEWLPAADSTAKTSPLLLETCRYSISGTHEERIIDCEYFLTPAHSNSPQPVHFGDTKEGMFAIRVPEAMRVDRGNGHILNSEGRKDGDAWGRVANWVDYTGSALRNSDSIYGIAILVHPKSFQANGYWHVRTYGLFAHNPIGAKDFMEGRPDQPRTKGGCTLAPNQSMHLFYRVILHRDRWTADQAEQRFLKFSNELPQLQ